MPPRVPADIDAARSFVQDIFTLPGQTTPRSDDYNFDPMPLWQFVSLAIGTAVAGDVNLKLIYALIGQRNSGKGMLMSAIGASFRGLVDAGKSANNLLGNSSDNDEAKKFTWMTKAAIFRLRLVWTNEIGTLSPKGETYIDGNLIKGMASGGDELEVRGQRDNPFAVRNEFTMFFEL